MQGVQHGNPCFLAAQVIFLNLHSIFIFQAEETKLQLEEVDAEVKTMKTKYNLAMNEVWTTNWHLENQNIHLVCGSLLSFIIIVGEFSLLFAVAEKEIIGYLMKQRFSCILITINALCSSLSCPAVWSDLSPRQSLHYESVLMSGKHCKFLTILILKLYSLYAIVLRRCKHIVKESHQLVVCNTAIMR